MSSYNRRFVLTGCALTASLAACGFTPVYGPGGAASLLQGAVLVDAPDTRAGFALVRVIEDRLGRTGNARYGLSYAITLSEQPIAISDDDITLRFNLLGQATYALRALDTGAVLTSGKVDNFTSYSASGSTVATQAAERDAQERLMVILAEAITDQLIIAAPGLPE